MGEVPLELRLGPGKVSMMDRSDAQGACCLNIDQHVVEENTGFCGEPSALKGEFVDLDVGLAHPDLATDDDLIE